MAEHLQLYSAQKQGVARFLAMPKQRFVLAYGTGCGKTPTAIACIVSHLSAQKRAPGDDRFHRILVVCPAIVRRHWVREFSRWACINAHAIEMGRHRSSGSKRALQARDLAYASPVQVVSYDLAGEVDEEGWDFIVFDEIHHLADCTSRQSRVAQRLMNANLNTPALGLSATLIPTELWQLSHPMHLLFGERWGRFPRAGKICWDFVRRWCHIEKNEHGQWPAGADEARMPELKKVLAKHTHRLSREDIADDLPPLDVSVLEVPGQALARHLHAVGGRTRPEIEHAVTWYRSLPEDMGRVVLLCYHRDVGQALMRELTRYVGDTPMFYIDGSMPTAERVEYLDVCEDAARCVLIATTESIREGVRLMWPHKVLLAEWRQAPAQVVQVLGRFASVGDRRRPQIEVLTDDSLFDQSQRLLERMAACNSVLKAGAPERIVEEVFAPRELTGERLGELTRAMLEQGPRGSDAEWREEASDDEW